PPGVVAGKARKWLDRMCRHGGFALPVAANDQSLAAPRKEKLPRAISNLVGNNLGAKHLDVPVGRLVRGVADDVDVIKGECGITHGDKTSSQQCTVGASNFPPLQMRCAILHVRL